MNAREGEPRPQPGNEGASAHEPTAVLPETAAQLGELERVPQAVSQAEETELPEQPDQA